MKRNGFTLIELLVVVAIIGILAAVGVVAYSGYTASAKANAVKTIGAQTAKYMQAEIIKCTLDSSADVLDGQACSTLTTKNAVTAMLSKADKSPVFKDKKVYKSGTSADYGYVVLNKKSTTEIEIYTCWKSGCGANDSNTATVTKE
ncbi:type IV pilin protein [Candidatus Pelagibacter sp. Uisw_090]|uniref:type IV pilin protein n=1 Tax=Candidatus Pelagibacter sp. Uisw_090 TaxID=3230993 RepID=UPI0039EBF2BA